MIYWEKAKAKDLKELRYSFSNNNKSLKFTVLKVPTLMTHLMTLQISVMPGGPLNKASGFRKQIVKIARGSPGVSNTRVRRH